MCAQANDTIDNNKNSREEDTLNANQNIEFGLILRFSIVMTEEDN